MVKRAADDSPTSRKNTADMLRRLRALNREARMLKVSIDAERRKAGVPRIRRPR